ncbi:MAG: DegT/DnrJ/EryC1/StrS family aminotransferase [Bacteroidetes bacterium]|nr:DegT/DnrJ/EryC1/StrS family aminotransferase [Bacteroidota bacterium]
MNVPLLDLKLQYQSLKSELDAAVLRVSASQAFILGAEVDTFERNVAAYLGAKHAIGVSSGTDALLLALMALDLRPGDEVIVPTYSFFATAGVVSRLNAVPVFTDVDPVTFNIDPNDVKRKITARTKAIVPVHLYGQSADMAALMVIANAHGIPVIEDGAQAIGVQYKDGVKVGNFGAVGCFSFFPSKNLGAFGDAGLVTTNDDAMAERLRMLRVHGSKVKYYHQFVGGNFRIDALQAAVLDVKLPHLDRWSARRRENAALYTGLIASAGIPVRLPEAVYQGSGAVNHHIYNQFVIRVPRRDELKAYLASQGIGTEIYYPVPFHRQECFAALPSSTDAYPISDDAAATSLALPIFPELTEEQVRYVADTIIGFYRK